MFIHSFSSRVLSCLVLSCLVLYCIVLSCLVLSCIVLSCIVLSCLVLYCLVLYCIVLYCLILSYLICPLLCLLITLYFMVLSTSLLTFNYRLTFFTFALASLIRWLILLYSCIYSKCIYFIETIPEAVNSFSSILSGSLFQLFRMFYASKRFVTVRDGIFLQRVNRSPFEGQISHNAPLLLDFFALLVSFLIAFAFNRSDFFERFRTETFFLNTWCSFSLILLLLFAFGGQLTQCIFWTAERRMTMLN